MNPVRPGVIGTAGRGVLSSHWHRPDGDSVVVAGMDTSQESLDLFKERIGPIICRDFIDMIRTEKRPVATPLAGRMSVAAACGGTESIRNGSVPVAVPHLPPDLAGFVY